jgi:hypothetical protein
METNTLKVLGTKFRNAIPLEDNKNSKELRRLLVRLERRDRELNQPRMIAVEPTPKRPRDGR